MLDRKVVAGGEWWSLAWEVGYPTFRCYKAGHKHLQTYNQGVNIR
jgi:hypothetical protein